MNKWLECRG